MASQIITLGVGTPGAIPEFILLGLSPGVAVPEPPVEPTSKRRGAAIQFFLRLRLPIRPARLAAIEWAATVRLSVQRGPIAPLFPVWGVAGVVGSASWSIVAHPRRVASQTPLWQVRAGEGEAGTQTRLMLTAEAGATLRRDRDAARAEVAKLSDLLRSLVDDE